MCFALPEGPQEALWRTRATRIDSQPGRGFIDLRPVIGAGQKQALVTLNERTSRYSLIAHVPFKMAQVVSEAMISLLTPFTACVHTLTTNHGKEFAPHERIAKELGADFFFAHPYASWERGAHKNRNGLIRQFFPKKMGFQSLAPNVGKNLEHDSPIDWKWRGRSIKLMDGTTISMSDTEIGGRILVTTLANAKSVSAADIDALYGRRWQVEVD